MAPSTLRSGGGPAFTLVRPTNTKINVTFGKVFSDIKSSINNTFAIGRFYEDAYHSRKHDGVLLSV